MKPKFIYNTGRSFDCPSEIIGKYIKILFRNGTILRGQSKAESYFWEKQGLPSDIIAYQIIEDNS